MGAKGKGNTFFFKKACLEIIAPSLLAFPIGSDFPSICQQVFISLLHSNALNYLLWQDKLCRGLLSFARPSGWTRWAVTIWEGPLFFIHIVKIIVQGHSSFHYYQKLFFHYYPNFRSILEFCLGSVSSTQNRESGI